MRKRKPKLELDRTTIKPVDEQALEHVVGGGNPPKHCTPTSIAPTARNCGGCW
ncbi:MAG TPA: hypothetical protein VMZ53_28610 [Kofleriaceae bacterium]|nr:hypothetical protein [Kofleriaceae bacterium]